MPDEEAKHAASLSAMLEFGSSSLTPHGGMGWTRKLQRGHEWVGPPAGLPSSCERNKNHKIHQGRESHPSSIDRLKFTLVVKTRGPAIRTKLIHALALVQGSHYERASKLEIGGNAPRYRRMGADKGVLSLVIEG